MLNLMLNLFRNRDHAKGVRVHVLRKTKVGLNKTENEMMLDIIIAPKHLYYEGPFPPIFPSC